MPREELYKELRIREKEVSDELIAIQALLSKYGPTKNFTNQADNSEPKTVPSTSINGIGARGSKTWPNYWLELAKIQNKKFKANDLAEIAINDNPDVPEKTIRTSAKTKLSLLAKLGKIKSERTGSLKDGNTYWFDK